MQCNISGTDYQFNKRNVSKRMAKLIWLFFYIQETSNHLRPITCIRNPLNSLRYKGSSKQERK